MDKIARIRQEIERRLNILTNVYDELMERKDEEMMTYYHGKVIALEELCPFLDTLSEEPDKSLEEAARLYTDNQIPIDYPDYFCRQDIKDAFIVGAEWQKNKLFKEGLDAVRQNSPSKIEKTIAGVFVKYGMDRMKEQMLKGAVEGEVYKFGEVSYVKERNNAELTKYLSQFNNGDKVRIIIVKEEE